MNKQIKQFVLMSKTNGELVIGYRVAFMDCPDTVLIADEERECVNIGFFNHDGWVIEHPDFEVPWFMNRKADKMFLNLGEL